MGSIAFSLAYAQWRSQVLQRWLSSPKLLHIITRCGAAVRTALGILVGAIAASTPNSLMIVTKEVDGTDHMAPNFACSILQATSSETLWPDLSADFTLPSKSLP